MESEPALEDRLDSVVGWLAQTGIELVAPIGMSILAGGRSNLTARISDASGTEVVIRRPPYGPRLPSAHDVVREARIMRALASTSVPVPQVVGICVDEQVIGSPFFVMRFVDGDSIRSSTEAADLTLEARRLVSAKLVGTLARIHAVDLDQSGLRDLSRNGGYLARQLDVWSRQWGLTTDRHVPGIETAEAVLRARMPEDSDCVLAHGDYRFDNVLIGHDGDVVAVLDWELATLGDPLADLGLLLAYWTETEGVLGPLDSPPTVLAGFPRRDEVIDLYREASERHVPEMAWYVALACWKLAIIMEGVRQRNRDGRSPNGADLDVDDLARRVDALTEQTLRELGVAPTVA